MKISVADWDEARAFLSGPGTAKGFIEKPEFRAQTEDFLQMVLKKNQELNLTGAKDIETLFWKHFVDSLAVLRISNLGITADWGCGGGFPGIPLALARKHSADSTDVYFVDSIGKKVRAVEEFCQQLDLRSARCLVGRGEELVRSDSLARIDTIMMRAVAPAERAWRWIDPAISHWLFLLGPRQLAEWKVELPRLSRKGFLVSAEEHYSLPRKLGDRCLLRLSKSST